MLDGIMVTQMKLCWELPIR